MYPKWRHHPTEDSIIVTSEDFELSITPDADGWMDGRNFPETDEPKPRAKPGPKPKVKE